MCTNQIMKCVATAALLSQILTYSNVSYAGEKHSHTKVKQEMQSEKNLQASNESSQGLLGYYFQNQNFQQLAFMAHRQASDLKIPKNEVKQLLSETQQHIQSVRWIGYIKPPQKGDYVLSTSADRQVIIELDGQNILNQSSMTAPIQLEKDKLYKIRIEYVPKDTKGQENLCDFQLNWSISGDKVEPIPENAFLLPDFSHKNDQEKIIPEASLFQEQEDENKVSRSKRSIDTGSLYDTDNDAIYDEWETEGYTIQRQIAVKWDDSMKELGYTKYMSNPYNSHTVGDPYTDWEKAAGRIDKAIKVEARHPLVAAYPTVGVHMEKLIVSEKQNISTGLGKTLSAAMSTSNTISITTGIDATTEASLLGPSASVTAHFSHTGSSTATIENSSSNNWSQDLGIDTGQSAYLNANVRYYNTGTAPIYNVKPTTNFVLDGDSIVTVKAKENQLGDVLKAGGVYPEKHLHPIALNTLDDFGSQLIPINYDQMKRLENGNKLTLETTQASGLYGRIHPNGRLNVDSSQEWEPVRSQIESVSAGIILDTGEETLERRVAARDYRNPEDLTPELTIGEAVKIGFNTTEKNGEIYYKDISLNESLVGLVFDESTAREVKEQLDIMPEQNKKIYNVKLKQGMNIMIKKPIWYSDFDTQQHNWTNATVAAGEGITGSAGKIRKGSYFDASLLYPSVENYRKLKPHTKYKLTASVRYPDLELGRLVGVYIGTNSTNTAEHVIRSNHYERISQIFTTSNIPDSLTNLQIQAMYTRDMLFDNITLIELGPSPFGKIGAYFSGNGRFMTFNFQSVLPGQHRLEIFMNGEFKGVLLVDFLRLGLNFTYSTNGFPFSPEEAMNPSNIFEIKYKGDSLLIFNGGNR